MLEVKIFGSAVTAYRGEPRFRGDPNWWFQIRRHFLGINLHCGKKIAVCSVASLEWRCWDEIRRSFSFGQMKKGGLKKRIFEIHSAKKEKSKHPFV